MAYTVVEERTNTWKYVVSEYYTWRSEGKNRGLRFKNKKCERVFEKGILCLRDSHVHDVCFMQRLVFDLGVDDGWVGDSCGVRTWGSWHHVV